MSSTGGTGTARYALYVRASGGLFTDLLGNFTSLLAAQDAISNVVALLDGTASAADRSGTVKLAGGIDTGGAIKAWRARATAHRQGFQQDFQVISFDAQEIPIATWTGTNGYPSALVENTARDPSTGALVAEVQSLTLRCSSLVRT